LIPSDKLVRRLATGATIVCVALVAVTVLALASPSVRTRLGFRSGRPASYLTGQQVDLPAPVWETSPVTLLIFARSTCSACQRAQSAFTTLVARLAAMPEARVLVVANSRGAHDEAGYARNLGLDDGHLVTVDYGGLRLGVVPTLILVDRRGVVRFASEGVPSTEQLNDLVAAARALAPTR